MSKLEPIYCITYVDCLLASCLQISNDNLLLMPVCFELT